MEVIQNKLQAIEKELNGARGKVNSSSLGKSLLTKCNEIIENYKFPISLLTDLKESLEKLSDGYYQQELADLLCQKLLQKEEELELLKKNSLHRQKILQEMKKSLGIICIETTPPERGMERLKENLLNRYQELICHYFPYSLLTDLKERIIKMGQTGEFDYNREIASFICKKIEQQV